MNQDTRPDLDLTFDLDEFEDAQTANVVIKHPVTGAPTGMFVTLAGPEHPLRKKRVMDQQRDFRSKFAKTGKLPQTDPVDDEETSTDLLIACTFGWKLSFGGTSLTYSPAAAETLYRDPKRQWLRAQLKVAFDERENFIVRSAAG